MNGGGHYKRTVHNKFFRTVFDRIRLTIGSVLRGKYKQSAISSAE